MKSYYGEPIESLKRSFERYHPRPPTASLSLRFGVRNPTTKLQSLLSQAGASKGTPGDAKCVTEILGGQK